MAHQRGTNGILLVYRSFGKAQGPILFKWAKAKKPFKMLPNDECRLE